jgi:hypothetical protein
VAESSDVKALDVSPERQHEHDRGNDGDEQCDRDEQRERCLGGLPCGERFRNHRTVGHGGNRVGDLDAVHESEHWYLARLGHREFNRNLFGEIHLDGVEYERRCDRGLGFRVGRIFELHGGSKRGKFLYLGDVWKQFDRK